MLCLRRFHLGGAIGGDDEVLQRVRGTRVDGGTGRQHTIVYVVIFCQYLGECHTPVEPLATPIADAHVQGLL